MNGNREKQSSFDKTSRQNNYENRQIYRLEREVISLFSSLFSSKFAIGFFRVQKQEKKTAHKQNVFALFGFENMAILSMVYSRSKGVNAEMMCSIWAGELSFATIDTTSKRDSLSMLHLKR